jgi:tetratricopeptide (TPR) repeat protein
VLSAQAETFTYVSARLWLVVALRRKGGNEATEAAEALEVDVCAEYRASVQRMRGRLREAKRAGKERERNSDLSTAEDLYRSAVEAVADSLGHGHPMMIEATELLAGVLRAQGRTEDADAVGKRYVRLDPGAPPQLPEILYTAYSASGDAVPNEGVHSGVAGNIRGARGIGLSSPNDGGDEESHGSSEIEDSAADLHASGEYAAAVTLYQMAIAQKQEEFGKDHPFTCASMSRFV